MANWIEKNYPKGKQIEAHYPYGERVKATVIDHIIYDIPPFGKKISGVVVQLVDKPTIYLNIEGSFLLEDGSGTQLLTGV